MNRDDDDDEEYDDYHHEGDDVEHEVDSCSLRRTLRRRLRAQSCVRMILTLRNGGTGQWTVSGTIWKWG